MNACHNLALKVEDYPRQKTIMIVGGGIMQVPAIRIAKEMGLKVIVTDINPSSCLT